MAKLEPGFGFTGTINNISAYKMRGSDKIILRSKGGPSKQKISRSPNFINTRRNNMEFGGRSKAAGWIMRGLHLHKSLSDYNIAGPLQALLRSVQLLDDKNPWGERNIALTKNPKILEGFSLNKKWIFDSVIRSPIYCELSRQQLSAQVKLPALMPGINFFSPAFHPVFSFSCCLAVVPDIFYREKDYKASEEYKQIGPDYFQTDWFAVSKGCGEQTLQLQIKKTPPDENFSLMLSVGLLYGAVTEPGKWDQALYAGSAKLLAMA
jgi:hypothetical protein